MSLVAPGPVRFVHGPVHLVGVHPEAGFSTYQCAGCGARIVVPGTLRPTVGVP